MKTLGLWLVMVGVVVFIAGWVVLYRVPVVDAWGIVAGLAMVATGGWMRWRWRGVLLAPVLTVLGSMFLVVAVNLGVRMVSGFDDGDPGGPQAAVTPRSR